MVYEFYREWLLGEQATIVWLELYDDEDACYSRAIPLVMEKLEEMLRVSRSTSSHRLTLSCLQTCWPFF